MRQVILAPVGRAEPDDVQGWFEQGGSLGLQQAWHLPTMTLRMYLTRIQRRDGWGMVGFTPGNAATVLVQLPNPVHRFLAAELPTFIIEGALLWARAHEQRTITIYMGQDADLRALWQEVLGELTRLGIIGQQGWTGIEIEIAPPAKTITGQKLPLALDALTCRLLPFVLWEQTDPAVTLLHTTGNFGVNRLHEIPLGLTIREFVFHWAGGIPANIRLSLGGRLLKQNEWDFPLTYEKWGVNLGSGVLECL